MRPPPLEPNGEALSAPPIRLLLLDDEPVNLLTRSAILNRYGYRCMPASTFEQAVDLFDQIDIAVLDYHLGAGKFGSDVAVVLRKYRPEVPIIILSATLEHYFGGAEDMHLLKGYSSTDDLVAALQSLEAKLRGGPVVVSPHDFFYSRICFAIGADVMVQVFDENARWVYCNEAAAEYFKTNREWFSGRSLTEEMPIAGHWERIIADVSERREAYIDRTRNGLLLTANPDDPYTWSIVAYPIVLHDGRQGVVMMTRVLEKPMPAMTN